jgi:hypothetical protein
VGLKFAGTQRVAASTLEAMRVLIQKDGRRGGYWSEIHRGDGVVLALPGYDRKWRVPHDLAHLVAERQLRLTDGVFGSIAAGGMFDNMTVLSGRLRYDARQRSQRILRANGRGIGMAEVLAGVVHHAVEERIPGFVVPAARAAWASLREEPFPYPATELRAAVRTLGELGERWAGLGAGEPLPFDWPEVSRRRRPATR